MLIGAMNHPARPLEAEFQRIAASGFDFVDVTLEPPAAWPCDGNRLAALLEESGLTGVGHTAYYLPIASSIAPLRRAAHEAMHEAFDVFALAGIERVNVHPDPLNGLFAREEVLARNAEALAELAAAARERGLVLMLENLGRVLGSVDELTVLFDNVPDLRFHLDAGHAHLGGDRTRGLLESFGERLAHVHVSDNFGAEDLHLPLGAGTVDWQDVVAALKVAGWDGTVTLEIFSTDRTHLESSRALWLEWWS